MPRPLLVIAALLGAACSSGGSPAPPSDATVPVVSARSLTFRVLFEGACAPVEVGHIGAQPAFVLGSAAYRYDGDELETIYRREDGGFALLGTVGGLDAKHAWVTQLVPSRTHAAFGTVLFAARGWKEPQARSPRQSMFSLDRLVETPDGTLLAQVPRYDRSGNDFAAWSSTGAPSTAPLPKSTMSDPLRLASGELIDGGRDSNQKVILRRWSATRELADLTREDSVPSQFYVDERVGSQRAVLVTQADDGIRVFYTYEGSTLEPVPIQIPVTPTNDFSWLVTRDDTLFVASETGIHVQPRGGAVTHEPLPEPGLLAQDPSHAFWMGRSGTLYARDTNGWTKLTLPEGPWASPGHDPVRIEWVRTVGRETWVGTYRPEHGGSERLSFMRTVYSSVPHGKPLRCGTPHGNDRLGPAP